MVSNFREKRVCKQFNEGLNKFSIELIDLMYTQKKQSSDSRLGLENNIIIPKKITYGCPHLHHLGIL